MDSDNNSLFLQNFNKAIDKTYDEINNDKYMSNPQFYNFIRDAMDMICTRMSFQRENPNKQIAVLQEDRMFEIIFDFFKSTDDEFYDKALKIIKNEYPNTKTYIYDYHKDDPQQLFHYSVLYKEGKATVFLPLRYKLNKNESEEIDFKYGEDFYTIDDLYSITHEISHLFDIQPENYTKDPTETRNILTEVTPGIFEHFLTDYLLRKGIFEESIIREKKKRINNKLLTIANLSRLKLKFLELKRRKGEIADEDIQLMMENDYLSNEEFINILNLIVRTDMGINESKRYAFCGMYAPMIFQKCKINSDKTTQMLKKYLNECSENLPFTDILKGFGIDIKREIDEFREGKDDIER